MGLRLHFFFACKMRTRSQKSYNSPLFPLIWVIPLVWVLSLWYYTHTQTDRDKKMFKKAIIVAFASLVVGCSANGVKAPVDVKASVNGLQNYNVVENKSLNVSGKELQFITFHKKTETFGGMSGGPAYAKDGSVVGILTGSVNSDAKSAPMAVLVPYDIIQAEWLKFQALKSQVAMK